MNGSPDLVAGSVSMSIIPVRDNVYRAVVVLNIGDEEYKIDPQSAQKMGQALTAAGAAAKVHQAALIVIAKNFEEWCEDHEDWAKEIMDGMERVVMTLWKEGIVGK